MANQPRSAPDTGERGSEPNRPQPRFLAIGSIVKAHGIRGEVAVEVLTDDPDRFATLEMVYLGTPDVASPIALKAHRWHRDRVLLTFEGITTRTEAEQLKGLLVEVPIDEALPLDEDHYYPHQLIGLQAVSDEGEALGEVVDFLETGANGVYVVRNHEREILLPAVADVVLAIDLEAGLLTVHLMEGLLD